jgi:hypothetical protein
MAKAQQKQEPRTEWPELVGKQGEEAWGVILDTGGPGIKIVDILPEDELATADFRTDRVRVFVDSSGKVVKPPGVG